jgi:purine-binding chemotaxis protein CheW
MENQIVVFELGGEQYGVNIAAVESIIKIQAVTRIPHTPPYVEGVTNLRGRVLPVIDLRKRFGLEPADASSDSRIVVAAMGRLEVGMIVDGVSEVLTIPDGAVEPAPTITTTADSAFITGIAKIDERLVILLDLARILSVEEQEALLQAV